MATPNYGNYSVNKNKGKGCLTIVIIFIIIIALFFGYLYLADITLSDFINNIFNNDGTGSVPPVVDKIVFNANNFDIKYTDQSYAREWLIFGDYICDVKGTVKNNSNYTWTIIVTLKIYNKDGTITIGSDTYKLTIEANETVAWQFKINTKNNEPGKMAISISKA